MLSRLSYRVQIPLGLSLAVVLAALLVTAVAAQISARTARADTLATVDRAAQLLSAQSMPLLAADDTWRVFALLCNTAAFLPGAATGQARTAVLDSEGRGFASSAPQLLRTAQALLGQTASGQTLPTVTAVTQPIRIDRPDGAIALLEPIRQVMLNMLLNGVSAAGEPGAVHAELRADADRLWFSVAHAGKALTQDAMEAKLVAESGDDPRGFGLWVCREIATQYGGGFDVDSHHGQGTRLVFWMPNREAHEELAAD